MDLNCIIITIGLPHEASKTQGCLLNYGLSNNHILQVCLHHVFPVFENFQGTIRHGNKLVEIYMVQIVFLSSPAECNYDVSKN